MRLALRFVLPLVAIIALIAYGTIILVDDLDLVGKGSTNTKLYLFLMFIVLGLLISLVNFVIARLSWQGMLGGPHQC